MFNLCFFLALVFISSFCFEAKWGPQTNPVNPHPAKRYTIHLEDSYKQRWSQIMTENKQEILDLVKIAQQLYAPTDAGDLPDSVIYSYDAEFYNEIAAVSELLGTSVSSVFWLNVMYEAYAFCTSIVIQDKDDYIFHGRNLDYSINKPIAKVAFHIDYYQNGSLLFRANVLGGFIGFITAEKPGKFSISANQRSNRFINQVYFLDRILGRGINFFEVFFNKRKGILMTIRKVLEKAESYQEALIMLSNTPLIAPAYYIVSGIKPNEGSVITMDRDGAYNITNLDVEKGVWFLAQTNYDRDLPDPEKDNRRQAAEKKIEAIGRDNINEQNLFDNVLATYPNFNAITILSAVYSARSDYWNATVWI